MPPWGIGNLSRLDSEVRALFHAPSVPASAGSTVPPESELGHKPACLSPRRAGGMSAVPPGESDIQLTVVAVQGRWRPYDLEALEDGFDVVVHLEANFCRLSAKVSSMRR